MSENKNFATLIDADNSSHNDIRIYSKGSG